MTWSNSQNTLRDRFDRTHQYLRISVTDHCNFRCAYCMPPQGFSFLPHAGLLSNEEIVRLARLFMGLGIHKIRLTGGEPMLRQDLPDLISALAKLEHVQCLAMTTNGFYLAGQAKMLKELGLQAINISLDTLRPDRFLQITGRHGLPEVLAGVQAAVEAGFESVKLNVVVMSGVNEDELLDFVAFTRNLPIQLRFIEYMPFQDNRWSPEGLISYAEMLERVRSRYELRPLPGELSAVAKEFELAGHVGTVGFITSMTDHFCGNCNRLRLTADGRIKTCLFDETETGLRNPLREGASDADLEALIRSAVFNKQEGHAPMETLALVKNRPMVAIGG